MVLVRATRGLEATSPSPHRFSPASRVHRPPPLVTDADGSPPAVINPITTLARKRALATHLGAPDLL